jgi:glucose 1-dehydrogenase
LKALAVYPEARRLAITDIAEPGITAPDEVLIRILEVGLCGTDKEIASFEYGSPPEGCEYLVIGHEGLGEVLEVGPGVRGLRPGDLVVPTVRRPCSEPDCPACAIGRQDFCYTGKFKERGIQKLHGFLSERIVEKEQYLHPVEPDLRDIAVLTEPLTIAKKALRQLFGVQDRLPWGCEAMPQGDRSERPVIECRKALVLGAGPVGLLGAMTLADAGFETMVYSNLGGVTARMEVARSIGCKFLAAEDISVEALPGRIGKVDVVYEAVGASELAFELLNLLGPNAVFIFTGVPGRKKKASIPTDAIMRNLVLKNQVLIGTVNAASEDFESGIRALGEFRHKWPGAVERLITGRCDPSSAPDILTGSSKGIKRVVVF